MSVFLKPTRMSDSSKMSYEKSYFNNCYVILTIKIQKLPWQILTSKCCSDSSLRRFWCNVVINTRTVASLFPISNPYSVWVTLKISFGFTAFKSLWTLFPRASTAVFVGKVLRMTTMSALLWPFIIVPFLKLPTCLTSSNCYIKREYKQIIWCQWCQNIW